MASRSALLHPLDSGICPVSGKEILLRPNWTHVRGHESRLDVGVCGRVILVRTRGERDVPEVEALMAIIGSILRETSIGEGEFCVIEDYSLISLATLAGRRLYMAQRSKLSGLAGLAFCGVSGPLRIMVELGLRSYQVGYPRQVCETVTEGIAVAMNWLEHGPAVQASRLAPKRRGLHAPRSLGELVSMLCELGWDEPGVPTMDLVHALNPWKPVTEAIGLIKRDLDILHERQATRMQDLMRLSREELDLQERNSVALQESRRMREVLARECMRNLSLTRTLVQNQDEIVFALGEIIESRSRETANHIRRVAEYAYLLGRKLQMPERERILLLRASPMHDAGKIGIPDAILNKPGKLEPAEFDVMKTHAAKGWELLKGSNREVLSASAVIAHQHHEKWNGLGYPRGISGADIHVFGRVTALADVFDALGSDRCYKKAWPLDKVLALVREERGVHFDPTLVDLFFESLPEFLAIRERYPDAPSL